MSPCTAAKKIALIVAADEPALFFSSVEAAETYLEAVDVRDGVYTAAYDAEGQPYSIKAQGNRVFIAPQRNSPPKPELLRGLLRSFLSRTDDPVVRAKSLSELLALCVRHLSA